VPKYCVIYGVDCRVPLRYPWWSLVLLPLLPRQPQSVAVNLEVTSWLALAKYLDKPFNAPSFHKHHFINHSILYIRDSDTQKGSI
jgi:hypothetical protein